MGGHAKSKSNIVSMLTTSGTRVGTAAPAAPCGDGGDVEVIGAARQAVLPLPSARGLSRTQAAAYIGVSPSLFDEMVYDGRMPGPKRINSRTVWDRQRLDEAFSALPDERECNPWDSAAA